MRVQSFYIVLEWYYTHYFTVKDSENLVSAPPETLFSTEGAQPAPLTTQGVPETMEGMSLLFFFLI